MHHACMNDTTETGQFRSDVPPLVLKVQGNVNDVTNNGLIR